MACTCSPALVALDREVDTLWPDRDHRSDGCCGDPAHAARVSDHNPDGRGYAHALDIDADLRRGPTTFDVELVLLHLYGATAADADPRVKNLILRRRIFYPHAGVRPRGVYPYDGPNPHDTHLHVSIFTTATFDTRRWLPEEDPMASSQELLALLAADAAMRAMLNRAPDDAGLIHWTRRFRDAPTVDGALAELAATPEARSR
jgi:hypothetical protein